MLHYQMYIAKWACIIYLNKIGVCGWCKTVLCSMHKDSSLPWVHSDKTNKWLLNMNSFRAWGRLSSVKNIYYVCMYVKSNVYEISWMGSIFSLSLITACVPAKVELLREFYPYLISLLSSPQICCHSLHERIYFWFGGRALGMHLLLC